jgi:galactose mutarotase-like enzyme
MCVDAQLMDMRTDDDSGTLEVSLDSATLSDAVKASYPFPFAMRVVYELRDGQLNVTFHVKGGEELPESGMPFSIGNHITLKFPYTADGSYVAVPSIVLYSECVDKGLVRDEPDGRLAACVARPLSSTV